MESEVEFINTQDDKGISLQITYDGVKYKVKVWFGKTVKEQSVPCSFEPRFGMDILDRNECLKVAETLALEIEQELKI